MNEIKFIERAQKSTSVGLIYTALSHVKPRVIYAWKTMVEMICGKGVLSME